MKSYLGWMERWYTVLFSLLLLLILYGLQKDSQFLSDWRFWIFPVLVLLEAFCLKMRDLHVVFGIAAFVTGIFSMSKTGITLPHVILFLGLLSAMPPFALSAFVAVFGWGLLKLAGKLTLLEILTKDFFLPIYLVAFLVGLHSMAVNHSVMKTAEEKEKQKDLDVLREELLEGGYYALPFVNLLAGIVLWGLQKAEIFQTPEIIRGLHPIFTGILLFAAQVITERSEG